MEGHSRIVWTAVIEQTESAPAPGDRPLTECRHEITGQIEHGDWIELPTALRSVGAAILGAMAQFDDPREDGLGDTFRIGIGIEYADPESTA